MTARLPLRRLLSGPKRCFCALRARSTSARMLTLLVPSAVAAMSSLRDVDLSHNRLSTLPRSLRWRDVEKLNVSHNARLTALRISV